MEQSFRKGLKVGRRLRGILVTLFVGVFVIATFSIATFSFPFDLRTTALAAQFKSMLSSDSDTAALNAPHRIYVQDWDHISVLDPDTGQVVYQIPLGPYANDGSVSLAVDPEAGRLFVTDIKLDSKNQAVNTLTVYRTSDWSIEQRIPVPNIVLYRGTLSSIAVSPDSKYLYVYNYSVREQKGLEPFQYRYWLSILDLATWTWLPREVDLHHCGGGKLFPTTPNLLYVFCEHSADVRVVDMSQLAVVYQSGVIPAEPRSGWSMTGVNSATVMNGTMYVVTDNREIHIKNPTAPQADRILTGATSAVQQMTGNRVAGQKIVPFQPIGLSSDGHNLFVPTGTEEERSHGIASEIAIISTESGEVVRTLHPQPFLWITFASDGATAYIIIAAPDIPKHFGIKLVRLDLESGAETEILSGALLPGMIITP